MKEQLHQRRAYQAVKIAILCMITYVLLRLLPVASGRSEGIEHAVPLAAIALNFAGERVGRLDQQARPHSPVPRL